MKIKVILIGVFIILAGGFENTYCAPPDYYPLIKIPVMDNGYNVNKFYDNPKYTKSLNYFLKAEYPAEEVISFYNSRFKADGWVISKEKFKGEWQSFTDGTKEGNPKIRQRLSLWIKPELEVGAFLALRYEMQNNDWGDLHVLYQIQPNIDYSILDQYLKKLQKKNGDVFEQFMEQIDFFLDSNGEINEKKFDHAVVANKDLAQYLIEYKKMVDKYNSEIKKILIRNKQQPNGVLGYKEFSDKELSSIRASNNPDFIMGAGIISLAGDPYSKTGMELLALASRTESPKVIATIHLIGNSLWQNNDGSLNPLKDNIARLLKDDNDNALSYYINALLFQEKGENKEALAQIKKGNEFKSNGYIKQRCDVALKAAEMVKWKKQRSHSLARLTSQNFTIHIKLRHLCRDLKKVFGQEAQEACMYLGENLEDASLTCMDRITSLVIQSDALKDMTTDDVNRSEIMKRYKEEHACGSCSDIAKEYDVPDEVDKKYYEIFLDKGEAPAQKYICDFVNQK